MTYVIVSGLPDIPKLNKLVFTFKGVLQRQGIDKFWVKELLRMPNSALNYANIEFYSEQDAEIAVESLNGYKYFAGKPYPLTARLDMSTVRRASPKRRSPLRRRNPSPYRRPRDYDRRAEPIRDYRRERSRERSPFDLEASKLDLEIELLRKKRMIMEEERRLFEERKKLELVQAFGPSALDDFNGGRDRGRRPRRSPELFAPRRRSPMRPRLSPRPRAFNHPPIRPTRPEPRPKERINLNNLPMFLAPCKIIIKEMNEVISKYTEPKEMDNFRILLRGKLRHRLAIILDKQPIMKVVDVVKLYRARYPPESDGDIVRQLVKLVRSCHLPNTKKGPKGPNRRQKTKAKDGEEKTAEKSKEDKSSNVTDEKNNTENTAQPETCIKTEKSEPETKPVSEANDAETENAENTEKTDDIQKTGTAKEKAIENGKTVTKAEANTGKEKGNEEKPTEVPDKELYQPEDVFSDGAAEESDDVADDWGVGGDDWVELNNEESHDGAQTT